MRRIFTIILLFVLVFSQVHAQSDPTTGLKEIPLTGLSTGDGHTFHFYSSTGRLNIGFSEVFIALTDQSNNFVDNFTVSDFLPLITESSTHSTPVGKVEKVTGKALYKTWFSFLASGTWSLSFNYTIGNSATKSAVISAKTISAKTKSSIVSANDTITQIGFFKDRHCVANSGSLTLPLTSSCGIGCGTGSGGMAGCWNSGLGVYVYDPTATGTLTRDSARSTTHFLLFDAESKELTRAFLETLPSAANGKITIKVKGYWTANGIASNKNEKVVPELISDSIDHYLKSFHLYSIEGVYIKDGVAKSYSYFDTVSYKLTPTDLAPKNITALHYTGGTRINFTAPANASSSTTTLKGYKVQVYDAAGNIVDKYTTTVTDAKATLVNVPDFIAGGNYTFTVTALYTGSGVEAQSQPSSGIITQTGFFKDRDCVNAYTLPLTRSCAISCATGEGSMAGCWKSGLGLFIYDVSQTGTVITKAVAKSDAHYLLFDAQSKELTRAFAETLPSAASGKISIKVTGYWSADSIASNKNETLVPELIADSIDHKLRAFHLLSIEGVYINGLAYSYSGFATTSYKLTPADLAPSNLSVSNYTGGAKVKFAAPANAASAKSTLKGYKARVYNQAGVLQDTYTTIVNDSSVTSINIAGFTANQDYTFTVSALYPGSDVVVESDPSNAVKDSIGGITLTVNDYPTYTDVNVTDYKVKLVDSFTYNSSTYYLTVAYPASFVSGDQTVKAYINKKDNDLLSYKVVDGGFYIEEVPYMRSMAMDNGGGSHTNFVWNSTDSVYEATINFSMPGDWRLSLKLYDNSTSTLIAGTDLDQNGDGSTLYWDVYLSDPSITTVIKNTKSTGISVYPTLSQGEITVVSPAEARIKVTDFTGKAIGFYQSSGSKIISLNVPSGLYFVSVESSGKTSVQKVIIRK